MMLKECCMKGKGPTCCGDVLGWVRGWRGSEGAQWEAGCFVVL